MRTTPEITQAVAAAAAMLALAALAPSIARRAVCTGAAACAASSAAAAALAAAPPDGLFPDCAPNGCVSSQDDRPAAWDNPWEYDGDAASAQSRNGGDTAPRKMSDGAV